LRLGWTETHVVLPVTQVQGAWALAIFGTPALPVTVTTACSGADAIALCVGAVVAYPVAWRARLAGLAAGLAMIVLLNTVRIGTLGLMVASPRSFEVLHLYVWPAILTLAIVAYVFSWMRIADGARDQFAPADDRKPFVAQHALTPSRRFILLAAAFVVLFVAASPLYLNSPLVLSAGAVIAQVATAILVISGIGAQAAGHVIITSRGAFSVTQECVATPLIPLYVAAVCAYAKSWSRLVAGLLATLPLFIALGIARVLLVSLPPSLVIAPTVLVHAFYQLLLGAIVVYIAAVWRHGRRAAPAYALAGLAAGLGFIWLLGDVYTRIVMLPDQGAMADPQGAVALLPAFQAGLYVSLCIAAFVSARWGRAISGFGVLALTQIGGLLALHGLTLAGFSAPVRDVRVWAVAGPIVIFMAVMFRVRPAR
jgi:exosortase/archaeosortase family protein